MVMQASGLVGLHQIAAEHGGAAPYGIGNYNRGGPYVKDIPANANIPKTGQIATGHFYSSRSDPPFQLQNRSINGVRWRSSNPAPPPQTLPENAVCYVSFLTNGQWQGSGTLATGAEATTPWGAWLLYGAASSYQVYARLLSGPAPSGPALETWHTLSANRSWSKGTAYASVPGTPTVMQFWIQAPGYTYQATGVVTMTSSA